MAVVDGTVVDGGGRVEVVRVDSAIIAFRPSERSNTHAHGSLSRTIMCARNKDKNQKNKRDKKDVPMRASDTHT